MWLLNAETRRLESFINDRIMFNRYAILSHTWGVEEVTFDDIHEWRSTTMKGYQKIEYACQQAIKDGISYVWIDSKQDRRQANTWFRASADFCPACCIDKKSSAELSEAINSMFTWYYNAQVCYAYLADVEKNSESYYDSYPFRMQTQTQRDITRSRWLTRGWTLQELIAPRRLKFFDAVWDFLGSREDMVVVLGQATSIPAAVLEDRNQLWTTSVAQRMSWAAKRTTSRTEDQAYALLGLFNVNMPLMYGEGDKAFRRLQEEIIRSRAWEQTDHSILVWPGKNSHLFASSASDFGGSVYVANWALSSDSTFELSNKGLRIGVFARHGTAINTHQVADPSVMALDERYDGEDSIIVVLNCRRFQGSQHHIALRLRRRPQIWTLGQHIQDKSADDDVTYERLPGIHYLGTSDLRQYIATTVTIARTPFVWPQMSSQKISMSLSPTTWIAGLEGVCPNNPNENISNYTLAWQHNTAIVGLRHLQQNTFYCNLLVGRRGQTRDWPDTSLTVLVDFERNPAQLFVKSSREWPVSKHHLYALSHERMTGDETRIIVQDEFHVLEVVSRYVSHGGEIHWNLEIGRPSQPQSSKLPPLVCDGVNLPEVVGSETLSIYNMACEESAPQDNTADSQPFDSALPPWRHAPLVSRGYDRPWTSIKTTIKRLFQPRHQSRIRHAPNQYNAPPVFELPSQSEPVELSARLELYELPSTGRWNPLSIATASATGSGSLAESEESEFESAVGFSYQTASRIRDVQQQDHVARHEFEKTPRSTPPVEESPSAVSSQPRSPFGVPNSAFLRVELGQAPQSRNTLTPDSGYASAVGKDSSTTAPHSASSEVEYDVRRLWRLPLEFEDN